MATKYYQIYNTHSCIVLNFSQFSNVCELNPPLLVYAREVTFGIHVRALCLENACVNYVYC